MGSMQTILFVCTGNTCRSPLAEAIARHWVKQGGLGGPSSLFIASAGISAPPNSPVSPETLAALERMGIQHEGRSKQLTREMIEKADLVIGMTQEHVEAARSLVPGDEARHKKIVQLDPDHNLEDPIGMGQETYDELSKRMESLIPKRLEELLGYEDSSRIGSSR